MPFGDDLNKRIQFLRYKIGLETKEAGPKDYQDEGRASQGSQHPQLGTDCPLELECQQSSDAKAGWGQGVICISHHSRLVRIEVALFLEEEKLLLSW